MTRTPHLAPRCKNCGRGIEPCGDGDGCDYEGWVHTLGGSHCCDGSGQQVAEPDGRWTTSGSGPDHWTPGGDQ